MTKGPKCVKMADSALDALVLMVENHFRHLPVMNKQTGEISGLVDVMELISATMGESKNKIKIK